MNDRKIEIDRSEINNVHQGDVDNSTNEAGRDVVRDSTIRDPWDCISFVMLLLIGLAVLVRLICGAW